MDCASADMGAGGSGGSDARGLQALAVNSVIRRAGRDERRFTMLFHNSVGFFDTNACP